MNYDTATLRKIVIPLVLFASMVVMVFYEFDPGNLYIISA
jgi:hypothetical protein